MTDTHQGLAQADVASDAAQAHDVFVSYSRADRITVVGLVEELQARGLRAWVDLEDIPPSAEWMSEIRAAIEAADGYLVVVSPDLARSTICAQELDHAVASGKRIVPVLVRTTDPESVPPSLAARNWIDATTGVPQAVDQVIVALRTDLDHLKAHTRLGVLAGEWARKGEPRALLLRGAEIAQAERTLASEAEPRPTVVQTRFVQASRAGATRRQRGLIGAVAAALIVSLTLSAVAVIKSREAERQRSEALNQRDLARSGQFASTALAQLEHDPETSLLLALEGARIKHTDLVTDALRESLKDSNIVLVYREHDGKVADLDFGPDGERIASVGYDNTVRIWNASNGQTEQTFSSPGTVWGVAYDPRGRWVATAVPGGVFLWDVETGTVERTLRTTGTIFQVEFDEWGTRIVGGGDEGTRVWDPDTGHVVTTIPPGPSGTYGADISPDGELVATGNGDGSVDLWDAETGRLIHAMSGHQDLGFFVRFSPSGERLVSVGFDRTARVWDVHTGEQIVAMPHSSSVEDADFLGDDYVVTAESDGQATIWDVGSGDIVSSLVGHSGHLSFLVVDQANLTIATASDDTTVRIWRAGSGASAVNVHREGFIGSGEFVGSDRFLTAGGTAVIEQWDARTGAPIGNDIHLSGPHEYRVSDAAVAGGTIAVSARALEGERTTFGEVILVDARSGERLSTFRREGDAYPIAIDLDAGGPQAASVWTDGAMIITEDDGSESVSVDGRGKSGFASVAFSEDGTLVAYAAGRAVKLIDPATGRILQVLKGHDDVVAGLAFSPDGSRLASASFDGTARVWDLGTYDVVETLRGHQSSVTSVAFSTDGNYIVTAANDGTVVAWASDGVELQNYRATQQFVTSAVFSPDGHRILVTGNEGELAPQAVDYSEVRRGIARIFDCEVCGSAPELLSLASQRVTRQLGTDELSRLGLSTGSD